jgi:hypothetical protein
MMQSFVGSSEAEDLFNAYRLHLRQGNAELAMESLEALMTRPGIERSPAFAHRYYVSPVLEDELMRKPVCADMVDHLEPYAFLCLAKSFQGSSVCTQAMGLEFGNLGLKLIGQFMFIYSSEVSFEFDSLIRAEQVFGKQFTVGQLLTMYHSQSTPGLIAAFSALYLSREGAQLPLNNPTSVAADRDLRFFGAKLTSASSLTGVFDVMTRYAQAPHSRKVALAVDLLSSLHENHQNELLLALHEQMGNELMKEAQLTVERKGLGKKPGSWQYPEQGLGL